MIRLSVAVSKVAVAILVNQIRTKFACLRNKSQKSSADFLGGLLCSYLTCMTKKVVALVYIRCQFQNLQLPLHRKSFKLSTTMRYQCKNRSRKRNKSQLRCFLIEKPQCRASTTRCMLDWTLTHSFFVKRKNNNRYRRNSRVMRIAARRESWTRELLGLPSCSSSNLMKLLTKFIQMYATQLTMKYPRLTVSSTLQLNTVLWQKNSSWWTCFTKPKNIIKKWKTNKKGSIENTRIQRNNHLQRLKKTQIFSRK